MKVLIVEDDPDIRTTIQRLLERDGYETSSATDGASTLAVASSFHPDLVLLDLVLGGEDGRDILTRLREVMDVPVIFVTGRGLEMDRVTGLRMGADDYVVKPFSHDELLARVESVLRRTRGGPRGTMEKAAGMDFGELQIDNAAREVHCRGELVTLTTKEFDLLLFMASSPKQVFSRQQLLRHVWQSSSDWQDEATVTEHVRRVRAKIEQNPDKPQWITTVRGVGYRFEAGAVTT
jgi:DNA-binding response OmpR family regulator